jgi:hypothetical protein
MSRHDDEWLAVNSDALQAISNYRARGNLSDGLIFDAIRLRLIEIGEAVKRISPDVLSTESEIPVRRRGSTPTSDDHLIRYGLSECDPFRPIPRRPTLPHRLLRDHLDGVHQG